MCPIEAPIFTDVGDQKGKVELPAAIFGEPGSRHSLFEAVLSLQANQRRGTSNTKTRGEVRGGGRKPWKQKGTGNARSGSIRSPLWRKGGIIFGPHPRSYRIDIGQEKRSLALQTALYEKAQASQVAILEVLPEGDGKTSKAHQFLKRAGVETKSLFVVKRETPLLRRSLRNIAHVRVVDLAQLNALIVMQAGRIFFTREALDILTQRVSQS